ncbi:MAG: SWIM zinc finger family protein [Aminipila sp.]
MCTCIMFSYRKTICIHKMRILHT